MGSEHKIECPFCGGLRLTRVEDGNGCHWTKCNDCGACGPVEHAGGDPVTWNHRLNAATPAPATDDDCWPKPGDKMRFLGENGYDQEREQARKLFKVGSTYTVKNIEVHSWSHSIEFDEVPGRFNGVMFRWIREVPATPAPAAGEREAPEGWVLAPVELIEASRLMPRKTLVSGGTETINMIPLPAHAIWAMDRALTKFDAEQAGVSALAWQAARAIPAPAAGERKAFEAWRASWTDNNTKPARNPDKPNLYIDPVDQLQWTAWQAARAAAPAGLTEDSAAHYLTTHGDILLKVLQNCEKRAKPATEDSDDGAYWRHEQRALQDIITRLCGRQS